MKTGGALENIGEDAERTTAWRIANEFQTPLGVIISTGESLENYFERLTPERRRLALEDILSAARQMNSTMDLLTEFENETNPKSEDALNKKHSPANRRSTREANHCRP
jgi:signal transduction histidine kinase